MKQHRLYDIDLYRFLAALLVVMFHYTFRGYAADDMSVLEFPALAGIFKYGYLGVDLFFIISGFVILLTAQNKSLANFAVSRLTRLFPAFWVAVLFTSLASILFSSVRFAVEPSQFFANLTMISGFFGVKHVDGAYWSLLVELRFYFLIAVLLILGQINRIEMFLSLWLLTAVANLVVALPFKLQFFLIPEWASYFVAGSVLYLIRAKGCDLRKLVMLFVAYLLSLKYALIRLISIEQYYSVDFSEVVVAVLITICFLMMLGTAFNKTTWINKERMLALGVLTYPLYLIHQNVGYMIFNFIADYLNKYLLLLSVIALMLLAAHIISNHFEVVLARYMKKVLNQRGLSILKKNIR